VEAAGTLRTWTDVLSDSDWPALLTGNGLSINVWGGFSYDRLLTEANFSGPAAQIFEELDTTNFEAVLEGLWHAQTVAKALGKKTKSVDDLYEQVRRGLFEAVRRTHIPWVNLPPGSMSQIAQALDTHESVYTTNYDLIPYWSLMHDDQVRIADFFWHADNTFDPDRADLWPGYTGLYYLHGGLHLWQDVADGQVGKWTNVGSDLINSIASRYKGMPQRQPLFVSEGTTRHKRRTIRRSEYLNFALATLRDDASDTVVLGTSLSPQDDHVVDALVHGGSRKIAVGLRPCTKTKVAASQATINNRLTGQKVTYFDVTTHPLGDPALSVKP
jgi:hypothetical protein